MELGLDVERFILDMIKKLPLKTPLAASYSGAKVNCAAAIKIGDVFLEKICSCTTLYPEGMEMEAYQTRELGIPTSPGDVCDTIHKVTEIRELLETCELLIRTWRIKRHSRIADKIVP